MKITCLCPTHGRAHIIGEAVESFIRQEPCGAEVELLIVNDCPEQPLMCPAPGVRVVNMSEPIPDCAAKFNHAIQIADGDLIAWWEDDDISLPFRLRHSLQFMEACEYYKQGRAWLYADGQITDRPGNLFFGSAMFRRSFALERGLAVPGEPGDLSLHNSMHSLMARMDDEPSPEETYFVYRWGHPGIHHDSCVAGTNADRFREFRRRTLTHPEFKRGMQVVRPGWAMDYSAMAAAAANARLDRQEEAR